MRKRLTYLLMVMPLLTAGCATPPLPDITYEQTSAEIQVAAASAEYSAPATLPTESALEGPHSVEHYVQFALERNPNILAARRNVAAQGETIPQVTALDDPLLMETVALGDDHSPQTAAGRMPNTLTLSQKFPWFGKLQVRGEIAEQQTKIALTDLATEELRVIENVKLSYYELAFHQRAIEITEAGEELLNLIVGLIDVRSRVAAANRQDVGRAQLELHKLQNRLIDLRRQYQLSQADLNALLHTSPEARPQARKAPERVSVPSAIDELYDAAVRCRPQLQHKLHAIVRDQRSRDLAKLAYYPDVTVGLGWQAITTNDAISPVANGNDNFLLSVGINVPIWRDKLRAGVHQAEHRVVASARKYDASRDDTFRLIKQRMVRIGTIEDQITLFTERIIPKAEETLDLSMADYRVAKVDFQQVIDNWNEVLMFEIQLARLEANLAQTLASLERVVGCQLASLSDSEASQDEYVPEGIVPFPESIE